jgi:hypothetical protein
VQGQGMKQTILETLGILALVAAFFALYVILP